MIIRYIESSSKYGQEWNPVSAGQPQWSYAMCQHYWADLEDAAR